ncbi:hypothetical protein C2E23DRAFT_888497 [Lenzites betulinus]|nr:hypothetical protein C2E23DRAFT_888497 [Lenzites betulinus]
MNEPGTCIVVRKDRKPLTKEAIEIVYKFHSYLLDVADPDFAERHGEAFPQPLSPEWLRSWVDDFREDEKSRGRKGPDYFP